MKPREGNVATLKFVDIFEPKLDFMFSLHMIFESYTAQYLGGLLKVRFEFWIFWPKCELLIMKISGNQIKVAILALK